MWSSGIPLSLASKTPAEFFWATGSLTSVLDNAPTYVVFFEPTPDGIDIGRVLHGARDFEQLFGQ